MIEIFDNIRKLYTFQHPCEALASYVEFFSETCLPATQQYIGTEKFTVTLFPSYTPTIWINLGAPYLLRNGNKDLWVDEYTDVLLLRNEIVHRENRPADNIFTVKFFPGGFEAIFGWSQTRIGSNIVPLSEVMPNTLIQRLRSLGDLHDRRILLEDYFLRLLLRKRKDHYFNSVQQIISNYCDSGMEAGILQLAASACISEKTLCRYFTNVVGTSPKAYFATIRARNALSAFIINPHTFSPYDHGYYDRSHFYREVIKFTGHKLSHFHS
ncbi:helix-turn-helix domain-containing protein [Chitinophaga pendula]|uniref:AraC family transcriptional regulator n=1 Tax=Chitinophaga TaxID=79328 RepID=UPI000BB0B9F4|nr:MULTISPECIES: helix-turn-helix domain-containing protein [Chitinophaga]ASZ11838.1 AraC family transcriptional regulator [Chitinophaga sp. MD30]UCJ05135.1 helix-turn-helix domain-containing protein [Chitinophaga pendula]